MKQEFEAKLDATLAGISEFIVNPSSGDKKELQQKIIEALPPGALSLAMLAIKDEQDDVTDIVEGMAGAIATQIVLLSAGSPDRRGFSERFGCEISARIAACFDRREGKFNSKSSVGQNAE